MRSMFYGAFSVTVSILPAVFGDIVQYFVANKNGRSVYMTSISTLIEFFNIPITEDKYKEVFLVREFLVWMNYIRSQEMEELTEEIGNLLKEHKTDALATFCKSADIQAEVIIGVGKNMKYIPGHTVEDEGSLIKTAWVSFKSLGRWHLVQPENFLESVEGYQRGGEILLESQGKTILKEQNESKGTHIADVDDFWFCLHPIIFIIHYLPDNPEWQLLPTEDRKNMSSFLSFPYLKPSFFIAKLQLLSEQTCVMHTKNGRCTVAFGADKFDARYISMAYKLSLRADTGDVKYIDAKDLPLLVRYAPGIGTFSFNIRFPVSGEYIFETYVSSPGMDAYNNCSETKIICTDPDPDCKKLPLDTGVVGYGFGYAAVDFGLKNPSSAQPNITYQCQQNYDDVMKEITFQIEDDKIADIEFSSDVVGEENKDNADGKCGTTADGTCGTTADGTCGTTVCTETRVDEVSGKLHVKAGIKREGEYALSIIAREKDSDQLYTRIVNYLLTTKSYEEDNEFERLSEKRKKTLTLQAKMQELNDKKAALTERIKAMQSEIDDLKKYYEENKNNKLTQTEEIFPAKQLSTDTRATQTTDTMSINVKETQTEDVRIAMVAHKETQSEETYANTGSSATGNQQTFDLRAIEKDGDIVIVAEKGEQSVGTDAGKQKASQKSKMCTVL